MSGWILQPLQQLKQRFYKKYHYESTKWQQLLIGHISQYTFLQYYIKTIYLILNYDVFIT